MSIVNGYDPYSLGLTVGKTLSDGVNVEVLCPFHDDSSFGNAYFHVANGWFNCFSCGESGSIKKLEHKLGRKAVITEVVLRDHRDNENSTEWKKYLTNPVAVHNSYLHNRGLTDEIICELEIRHTENAVIFPVRNYTGDVVGVNIRNTNNKNRRNRYTYYGEKVPLYPLHKLLSFDMNKPVLLVEGAFGVVRGMLSGFQTLSVNSAAIRKEVSRYLSSYKCLAYFDNDDAGYIGAIRLIKFLPATQVIVPGAEVDELEPRHLQDHILSKKRTSRSNELMGYIRSERGRKSAQRFIMGVRRGYYAK